MSQTTTPPIATANREPRNLIFVLSFIGIGSGIASLFLWNGISILFSNPLVNFTQTQILLTVGTQFIVSYTFVLAYIVLISLLIPTWWMRLCMFTLVTLPLFVTGYPIEIIITTILALIIALSFFDFQIQRDIGIHITLPLRHIFNRHVGLISSLISVLLSVLLYFSLSTAITNTTLTVPNEIFSQAITLSAPLINSQIDSYLNSMLSDSISQLETYIPALSDVPYDDKVLLLQGTVTPLLMETLKKQGLSESQITDLSRQAANSLSQNSPGSPSSPNSPQQTISSLRDSFQNNILSMVSDQLNTLLNQYKDIVPFAIAISSFTLFNLLGLMVNALSVGLARVFVNAMISLRLIDRHTFTVEAERYIIRKN